jgi:hypothetical protein
MKSKLLLTCLLFLISALSYAQSKPFEKLSFIIGEWEGTGSGFGNEKSKIESSFQLVMDSNYIEVRNESKFEPTPDKPEGELHIDHGFISWDKHRSKLVFRQFNIEGYINTYLLIDSLSNENKLIFQTESIENFAPGGSARWTINKIDDNQIETIFDVSFPDQGYTCFGTNLLRRKE